MRGYGLLLLGGSPVKQVIPARQFQVEGGPGGRPQPARGCRDEPGQVKKGFERESLIGIVARVFPGRREADAAARAHNPGQNEFPPPLRKPAGILLVT